MGAQGGAALTSSLLGRSVGYGQGHARPRVVGPECSLSSLAEVGSRCQFGLESIRRWADKVTSPSLALSRQPELELGDQRPKRRGDLPSTVVAKALRAHEMGRAIRSPDLETLSQNSTSVSPPRGLPPSSPSDPVREPSGCRKAASLARCDAGPATARHAVVRST